MEKKLKDLLDHIVHKDKFKDNSLLYMNQDLLKKENDSDDDDNKPTNNWSKFKGSIKDEDDEDMININNEN